MLLRLEVLDEKTGICLYDKTWKWPKKSEQLYPALCKLIKSLFQVSKSLKVGDVSFLDFDVNNHNEAMRLSCVQEQAFIIGLFHSIGPNIHPIDPFLQSLKEEFTKLYSNEHESLRAELDSIADEKAEPLMTEEEILERFKEFDKSVDKCVEEHLPNYDAPVQLDISETEESESKKTSEKSKERKMEEEEDVENLIP